MRRLLLAAAGFAISTSPPAAAQTDPSIRITRVRRVAEGRDSSVIAITRVTVIDPTAPTPRRDQTVVIRGDRIVSVGTGRDVAVPAGARVLDGRGKFLIPGLWDMHAHTTMPGGRAALPLFVAAGVTGVRDLADDWDVLRRWREEIDAGTLIGPRIVAAGPYLEGGDVPIPHLLARTPEEARAAVDSLVTLGVDFVKLHGQLKRDVFFAAGRRARERGIPFVGHVPRSITIVEASDSGQRSLEHLLQFPTSCTPADSVALTPKFPIQAVLIARCTSENLAPVWAHLVRNGTWVVPTLVAQYEVAHWPKRDLPGDAYAKYLPDSLRRFVAQIFPMPDDVPPGAEITGHAMFARRVALVGELHRAGVAILPGTDAPLRNSPPGFSVVAELELFVKGGMSNRDALRSATWEPARYFGTLDAMGTVEPGKFADLVLLDRNPLDDIGNLRRVVAVIANGRLMDRAARQALLAALERGSAR